MKQLKILMQLFLVSISLNSFAQYEVGAIVGMSNYDGDLSKSPFTMSESNFGGGLFGRYLLSDHFAVGGQFGFGKISGDDANKKSSDERGLSFESKMVDFNVTFLYHLYPIEDRAFNPYVYAGAGVFKFNPQAEVNGKMVELQPLGTEGQGIQGYGSKYKLTQFSLPHGVGVKYQVKEDIAAFLDFGARKTFTDYLDDVGSEKFADPVILSERNGSLAYQAAYKGVSDKGWPSSYDAFADPTVRDRYLRTTDNKGADWYYLIGIGGSYTLWGRNSKHRSLVPKARRRVPYRYNRGRF